MESLEFGFVLSRQFHFIFEPGARHYVANRIAKWSFQEQKATPVFVERRELKSVYKLTLPLIRHRATKYVMVDCAMMRNRLIQIGWRSLSVDPVGHWFLGQSIQTIWFTYISIHKQVQIGTKDENQWLKSRLVIMKTRIERLMQLLKTILKSKVSLLGFRRNWATWWPKLGNAESSRKFELKKSFLIGFARPCFAKWEVIILFNELVKIINRRFDELSPRKCCGKEFRAGAAPDKQRLILPNKYEEEASFEELANESFDWTHQTGKNMSRLLPKWREMK